MESPNTIVQTELSDGTIVSMEATQVGEQLVSNATFPFEKAAVAIEAISREISEIIQKVKPDKASAKFGLEIAVESDGLTALLVKGSGKSSLEITLEWNK
jgi:tRNA U34 5-methylaminomethyl-2-thiouridine-forming methyltransferase MnmC